MNLLSFLFISASAFAVIHGVDDRKESTDPGTPALLADLAKSSPAIMKYSSLKLVGDHYVPQGASLQKYGFCPEASFSDQLSVARCSSSLVGEDLILTAGHCVDDDLKKWCQSYAVVFDFISGSEEIPQDSVYGCKEVLYRKFVGAYDEDLALIKLDRKVLNRKPILLSKDEVRIGDALTLIGYPLGIPQKIADNGRVTGPSDSKVSFRHDVDSQSCNSGGPLFNAKGEQVGVLVRGTGMDYGKSQGKTCYDWGVGSSRDWTEANSILHLPLP